MTPLILKRFAGLFPVPELAVDAGDVAYSAWMKRKVRSQSEGAVTS
ncbi:MAG: hypothetical protein ACFB4I_20440 [Cyanophyceae cyanobacterium]